jgi:hypothetical protein
MIDDGTKVQLNPNPVEGTRKWMYEQERPRHQLPQHQLPGQLMLQHPVQIADGESDWRLTPK